MTDDLRDEYSRRFQALAAERVALLAGVKPKRSMFQKIRDLVAREPHPAPARISGEHVRPTNWHSAVGQLTLLDGPRCTECRASMLPGSGLLSERGGQCGACQKHPRATAATPEPPRAA